MDTLSPAALITQLQWRYATKKFDPTKKISAEIWSKLEEALILTPSSFGLQPWKFVVVTDEAVKQSLVGASWRQTQPAECSHFVVFAARKSLTEPDIDRFLERQIEVRGGTVEALAGYRKVIAGFTAKAAAEGWLKDWAMRQAYIAIGNFMTSCAMLGIDTCPMEGIAPDQFDRILKLEGTDFATVVACAAGYRSADDKYATELKVRFPASELIQHI
jgi:nitroreductase